MTEQYNKIMEKEQELHECMRGREEKGRELEHETSVLREQLLLIETKTKAEIKGYQNMIDIQRDDYEALKANYELVFNF